MENIIETILLLSGGGVLYALFFLISSRLISRSKRMSPVRKYKLQWLMTHGFCLIFFLAYGWLDNYCGVRIVPLEALWFIITPFAFLGLVWNAISFIGAGLRTKS